MELLKFNEALNTILNRYVSLLKQTVHVRTGALQRSIQNNDLVISMLEYGLKSYVWDDNNEPVSKLRATLEENRKELITAFKEDLKIELTKIK